MLDQPRSADDGRSGGTSLVLDINSSGSTSSIFPLDDWAVADDTLYFVPDDGTHGYELWKSDGTTGGTVMVKDINSGGGNGITHDTVSWFTITEIDGAIYFRANDGTHGSELWKTDGTSAGTGMFQDIYAGASSSNPRYITALNDQLFFSGTTAAGIKLWSVDPRVSDLYYTDQWQVAEERINGVMTQQNVFSPVYVDAVVLRDRDLDGDGQVDDERLYPMHDANFNVTGLLDDGGSVIGRVIYDPYLKATFLQPNWSADADGYSDVSLVYLGQGLRHDASVKLYDARNRLYDPELGRSITPDQIGYPDGANRNEWEMSNPVGLLDPRGLAAEEYVNWTPVDCGPPKAYSKMFGGWEVWDEPGRFWGTNKKGGMIYNDYQIYAKVTRYLTITLMAPSKNFDPLNPVDSADIGPIPLGSSEDWWWPGKGLQNLLRENNMGRSDLLGKRCRKFVVWAKQGRKTTSTWSVQEMEGGGQIVTGALHHTYHMRVVDEGWVEGKLVPAASLHPLDLGVDCKINVSALERPLGEDVVWDGYTPDFRMRPLE